MPFVPPPKFADNQFLSAEGHLNPLINNINFLYDSYYRWCSAMPNYMMGREESADPTANDPFSFFHRGWLYYDPVAPPFLVYERGYNNILPDFYMRVRH